MVSCVPALPAILLPSLSWYWTIAMAVAFFFTALNAHLRGFRMGYRAAGRSDHENFLKWLLETGRVTLNESFEGNVRTETEKRRPQ